jgi:EAL domain-containing protein (putative c-di-GMP-specific phosphodiesterase class I)
VEVLTRGGQRFAVLKAGEIFGEVALLDQLPRTATVRTFEPTTLLRIERGLLLELLSRTDPVIRHLLELLLVRFRARSADPDTPTGGEQQPLVQGEDHAAATLTLQLSHDLAHALENGQLALAYQPLVSLKDRSLVGFEALIRWQHPLIGCILPAKLIRLAEKTGQISAVGLWVLQRAIRDWPELRAYCRNGGFISVNLSGQELAKPDIVVTIENLLASAGMPPQELKVELTETALIDDVTGVVEVLRALAQKGIAIALDDFGTCYSGFDYLKLLPISGLKIDKSFVLELDSSTRSRELVQTSLQLARSLGLQAIAEGVETAAIAAELAELGCDIAQGFYFARPMSLQAIPQWHHDALSLGRLAA